MADKKKSSSSVYPFFIDGEQPSANKFNSISVQSRANFYTLETVLGDVWAESEPYNSSSTTKLSSPISKKTSLGLNGGTPADGFSLNLVNLGRVIGPISKLNPFNLTEGLYGSGGTIGLTREVSEDIPENIYSYSLRFPGVNVSFSGTNAPSASVTSPGDLTAPGDYYFDSSKSIVYFYDQSLTDWNVTYDTTPSEYGGGSSYTGSSFNLIPDEASLEQGQSSGLQITPAGDYYDVVLPSIVAQNIVSGDGSTLHEKDINYGAQLKVPHILRQMFGADFFVDSSANATQGELIPSGFLYLKNYTTGEIYTEGEYYFISDTHIQVRNVELDLSSTMVYCLVTVGTDITSSIQDLKVKQFNSKHDRSFGEQLIDVKDLGGATDIAGNSGPFTQSENSSNFAPQYLHRDGYVSTVDDGLNDHNAMRGNLLLGLSGGSAGSYVGSGTSFKLYFGDEQSYIYRGSTSLYTRNEGNIHSRGYDLLLRGDNMQTSTSTDSDLIISNFTNFEFRCEPNEYRSNVVQRPGGFEFRGGPVYMRGLDARTQSSNTSASTAMALAKRRAEIVTEDSERVGPTMPSTVWKCPGVGMMTAYFNDIDFAQYTPSTQGSFGLTTGLPYYLDIPLPKIGDGFLDQYIGEPPYTTTASSDIRVTCNQIISIEGMIKNSNSNYYVNIGGYKGTGQGFFPENAVWWLKHSADPDDPTTPEYIRILVPSVGEVMVNNNREGSLATGHFDFRITIFYLTHR